MNDKGEVVASRAGKYLEKVSALFPVNLYLENPAKRWIHSFSILVNRIKGRKESRESVDRQTRIVSK